MAAAFLISLADERRVCSLARPGQRRASLAQHSGARSGLIASLALARSVEWLARAIRENLQRLAAAYLVLGAYRATQGYQGRRAAYLALAGFACLMFNYLGVNFLFVGFHGYAGVG